MDSSLVVWAAHGIGPLLVAVVRLDLSAPMDVDVGNESRSYVLVGKDVHDIAVGIEIHAYAATYEDGLVLDDIVYVGGNVHIADPDGFERVLAFRPFEQAY